MAHGTHRTHIKVLILLPTVALTGLTAACGAAGNGSGGAAATSGSGAAAPVPEETRDDRLTALVPTAVAADGKVTVGQDQTYPPNEFVNWSW